MALAGEWHVAKPISAIHDQIQLRRQFGQHSLAVGAYLAHYTQENHWNFTDVLTDVRDNPAIPRRGHHHRAGRWTR